MGHRSMTENVLGRTIQAPDIRTVPHCESLSVDDESVIKRCLGIYTNVAACFDRSPERDAQRILTFREGGVGS